MDKDGKHYPQGLTLAQAAEKLKNDGYNELPSQKKHRWYGIFLEVLQEPMLLLLLAAGTIYFFLGERQDALMLSGFVVFIIGITFYQQRKTERALEALRDLSSPRALVVREGARQRIAGREVVVGDIMVLCEGDRVAADAVIVESANLTVDESLLTGESLAVAKSAWDGVSDVAGQRPGGDGLAVVYSGTLVTRGHGTARVIATGVNTEMGKIGKSLRSIGEEATFLKKETGRLVKIFGITGLFLCVAVIIIYGVLRGKLLEGFLYGLTISMSMLPEEFPVVMLIFLTLGAWRISKVRVLTRNTAAIETLGAANVLCVDKTGTLTLNQMRLQALATDRGTIDLDDYESGDDFPDDYKELLEYSMLASQSDPFDPLEKEIKKTGDFYLFTTGGFHADWKLIKEYPFSGNLLALSHVWEVGDGNRYVVAAKGAPESIADLCHLSENKKEEMRQAMAPLFARGLRLIAVAVAGVAKAKLDGCSQHDFEFEFVGMLGFNDPVRPSVPPAIKECYDAGIRVCMITGDYPDTARFVARSVGLKNADEYLTGSDLQALGEKELLEKIKTVNIFARVVPEQKMLIVNAFKKSGLIISMTGDGVNDAPALKASNIGIAMGERGTDVARETADLVLLNDDFSSIVHAVKTGRMVFDNIKKAIAYIFAVHIPIAGMSFLPVAMGLPVVFMPAHIAFLELVIDPACSVVFEAEPAEGNIMKRPPRRFGQRLFDRKALALSLLQGLAVLVAVYFVYLYGFWSGQTEGQARALAFAAIVFANLSLIVTNLSDGNPLRAFTNGNKAFNLIFFGTLAMLVLILSLPALRSIFHFEAVGVGYLGIALAAGIAGAFLVLPFKKLFAYKQ